MTLSSKESNVKKAEDRMINEGGLTPHHAVELEQVSKPFVGSTVSEKSRNSDIWIENNKSLNKTFTFETFSHAIAFMVEVSLFCEKTDHHPTWKNTFNKIEVSLNTHDAGGITGKDRKLAAEMDQVFGRFVLASRAG